MKETTFEPTHSFLVADAVRLGSIEKAIILKEIKQMTIYKQRNGQSVWVYYSAEALSEKFPYMARRSIQRWIEELLTAKELISIINNKKAYDKTKSYTLPEFESLGQNGQWIGQNEQSIGQNGQPIPPLSTSLSSPPGETEVSRKETVKEKDEPGTDSSPPSFDEYMVHCGYEPYELEQNDYIYQTYRRDDGTVLSQGKLKEFQRKYDSQYKRKSGLENIITPRRVETDEEKVINLFAYNPGYVTWFKNKTQKAAIKELLVNMTIPQIAIALQTAKERQAVDRYAPQIDTPYELLTKMIKLKSNLEKPGFIGVV